MKRFLVSGWLGLVCLACGSDDGRDNPTRGSIKIAADESFQPVIAAVTSAYQHIYPRTSFQVDYLPEQKAVLALLQDSVRMVFVSRMLTPEENEMVLKQSSTAKTHHVATDAVALITSRQNAGTQISVDELKKIFRGEIRNWEQLSHSEKTGAINLVFDDANSSNLIYLSRLFNITDFRDLRISVAGSHQQVVDHVKQNPSSIGFIGMSWISDGKELSSQQLAEYLYVIGVARDSAENKYYYPFQEDLQSKYYPLARELYAITREAHSGLGGGLLTYIARDVGGLIITKMGLVPTVPYPRDVILKTE